MSLHSKSIYAYMYIVTQRRTDVGGLTTCCYEREMDVNENYSTVGF